MPTLPSFYLAELQGASRDVEVLVPSTYFDSQALVPSTYLDSQALGTSASTFPDGSARLDMARHSTTTRNRLSQDSPACIPTSVNSFRCSESDDRRTHFANAAEQRQWL